jgi:hypothetical protein
VVIEKQNIQRRKGKEEAIQQKLMFLLSSFQSLGCEAIYLDNAACSKATHKSSIYRGDANEYKTE